MTRVADFGLESFVPGRSPNAGAPLPPDAARTLRLDTRRLYAALEAERAARGLTWQAVAADSGVGNAATLTRLRDGGRVMFPEAMRILTWLDAPVRGFVRAETR